MCAQVCLSLTLSLTYTHTIYNTHWGRLALLHNSTCSAEGERSAHLSSLKSRCDSKFFRPLWDGRSCYSSQDGGQGSGCLMIEEKRSKFILLRALCQVPVAYCWEPLTHHRVTAPEVTSNAINLPRLLNLLPSPGWAQAAREAAAAAAAPHSHSNEKRQRGEYRFSFWCCWWYKTRTLGVRCHRGSVYVSTNGCVVCEFMWKNGWFMDIYLEKGTFFVCYSRAFVCVIESHMVYSYI